MTRSIRRVIAAVTPLTLVLVAAACGGSGSGSVSAPAASASAATTSAGTGAAMVSAGSSTLGRIVVNGTARTLYLFEKDTKGHSACNGACATYWPPLLSKGRPVAGNGAMQSLIGTIQRADGTMQVTYAGHPLYTYIQDTKPGQTTGEGSTLFGAGWDALTPGGKKIEAEEG